MKCSFTFKPPNAILEWPEKCQAGETGCEDSLKCHRSRPIFDGFRFSNPWPTWQSVPNLWTLLKWKWKYRRPKPHLVRPNDSELNALLPVCQPDFVKRRKSANDQSPPLLSFTWLGHATCVVEIEGISLITDPIFSEFCNPLPQFLQFGDHFRRIGEVPCSIENLPQNLSLVLISHNHYDHLSYAAIRALIDKYGQQLSFCVPKGLAQWFHDNFVDNTFNPPFVLEFTWWQSAQFALLCDDNTTLSFHVVCTPCQHWSERVPFWDTNHSLWCSWAVVSPRKKFFFAGDTGYCSAFAEIGHHIGPFDLAAIPIGAYHPREFLAPQHVDPLQAVKIHNDIRASKSIGIHWGSFPLGDESFSAPREELKKCVKACQLPSRSFVTTCPGETVHL